jgi:predicted AAA+ superfamily ATPase
MSAESETAEIIRRRLFEWDTRLVGQDGKVLLPKDAEQVCNEFADMLYEYRQQIPQWFSIDHAREIFKATYPFHPMVLSVFERKWQVLPRFQQTRGVLRLLATWVSRAYQEGYKGAHKDTLIATGSAPLEDSLFRAAIFEQLGESRLEGAVTTDICGRKDSHALRLDNEAVDSIKKSRLHKKVATTIFFESNGGMAKAEATLPEIRLAVAEPDIDIGNIETVLETLGSTCYYLSIDRNRFQYFTKFK